MEPDPAEIIRLKLDITRQELLSTIESIAPEQWSWEIYAEGSHWTAADLLRHITSAESSMTQLVQLILQGGSGVPEDFDLDRWNASRVQKAKSKGPSELVEDLAENRIHLLALIDSLQTDDWSKQGRHGSLQIMSIEEILNLIADHETGHVTELKKHLLES